MIDLHLHLDGSLPVDFVISEAKKQGINLPADNEQDLKKYLSVSKDCESLNDYLKCFNLPLSILQSTDAITNSVYKLQEELKKQGLIYAEIRFAPQLHTQNGLTQKQIIEAAIKGLNKSDFKANLILCCMRGDSNEEENIETVLLAKEYLNKGVCAVDLAGAEGLFATKNFAKVFKLAKELKVPFTIHAGEADGPESVKEAINFGASRIGHGVYSIKDEKLLSEIIEKQIPFEICPTSNFQTKTLGTVEEYPIKKFIDMGVKVTINTDNMTVSDTNIFDEYKFLKKNFGITDAKIKQTIDNSIDAAFISEKEKTELREKFEKKYSLNSSSFEM